MSACLTTTCRVCGDRDRDNENQKLSGIRAIAKAISAGDDLGGVFKLGEALAKARVAIGIGDSVDTMEAHRAASDVLAAQERVAAEFNRIAGRRRPCPCCRLRDVLASLANVAVEAVADERQGIAAGYEARLLNACMFLASYAGDEFPDEDATRTVLERAREVFLAAFAAMSPERRPQ